MSTVKRIREQLRKRTKLQRFAIMAALLEEDGLVADGQGEKAALWLNEKGVKVMNLYLKGRELFGAIGDLSGDALGSIDDLFGGAAGDPE